MVTAGAAGHCFAAVVAASFEYQCAPWVPGRIMQCPVTLLVLGSDPVPVSFVAAHPMCGSVCSSVDAQIPDARFQW